MDCQTLLRDFFLFLVHVFVKMKKEKGQIKDLNVNKRQNTNLRNIKIITGILLIGDFFFFLECNKI